MITTTRLRKLRLKYHVSLNELAELSGMPNQRLSDYERGVRRASRTKRERIAGAFLCLAEQHRDSFQSLCCEIKAHQESLLTPVEVVLDES